MKLETKLRFVVGTTMVALFVSILLSGRNELILLLLTAIQAKVFHVRGVIIMPYGSITLILICMHIYALLGIASNEPNFFLGSSWKFADSI
jgi:hypothetical protein